MTYLKYAAVLLGATVMAAPASAAHTICTTSQLANVSGATACWYVAGNANGNAVADRTLQQAAIGALGASNFTYNFGTNASNSFASGTGHTSLGANTSFGQTLFGETIVSLHYGGGRNSPFGQGQGGFTAFYLLNIGTATNSISVNNTNSLSNAHLFSTQNAVPEPATWAMFIFGFGVVGGAMRLRRGKLAFAF